VTDDSQQNAENRRKQQPTTTTAAKCGVGVRDEKLFGHAHTHTCANGNGNGKFDMKTLTSSRIKLLAFSCVHTVVVGV